MSRHVPPTDAAFSRTTKSVTPVCRRRIAIPRPAKPVPMMAMSMVSSRPSWPGGPKGNVRAFIRVSPIWLIFECYIV